MAPDYEGHGQCIEAKCFGTDHRFEEIRDEDDNVIGSSYTCLRCDTLDVRWSSMYRIKVLDGFDIEEPEDTTFYFKIDQDTGEVVQITEEQFLADYDDDDE